MKAFRNTGVEGSSTLATQSWLLAQRRAQQRAAKITGEKVSFFHRTGKGFGPPVKTLPKLAKGTPIAICLPVLLKYADGPFEPLKHGSSSKNRSLAKAGLIQCVDEPDSITSDGQTFGDTYLITKAGREYVQALRDR